MDIVDLSLFCVKVIDPLSVSIRLLDLISEVRNKRLVYDIAVPPVLRSSVTLICPHPLETEPDLGMESNVGRCLVVPWARRVFAFEVWGSGEINIINYVCY